MMTLDPDGKHILNLQTCVYFSNAAYSDPPQNASWYNDLGVLRIQRFANNGHDIAGFVARTDGHIIVSFRGSENFENWFSNLSVKQVADNYGGQVHSGFWGNWLSVHTKVLAAMDRLWQDGDQVWYTGHSLGGALALLAAWWLGDHYQNARVITFGQPRVGNPNFASQYPSHLSVVRVVNNMDIVPHMPSPLISFEEYQHVGESNLFDEDGHMTKQHALWDRMVRKVAMSIATRQTDEYKRMIVDHRIQNYIRVIDAAAG